MLRVQPDRLVRILECALAITLLQPHPAPVGSGLGRAVIQSDRFVEVPQRAFVIAITKTQEPALGKEPGLIRIARNRIG